MLRSTLGLERLPRPFHGEEEPANGNAWQLRILDGEIGLATHAGSIRVDNKRLLGAVKTEELRGLFQSSH